MRGQRARAYAVPHEQVATGPARDFTKVFSVSKSTCHRARPRGGPSLATKRRRPRGPRSRMTSEEEQEEEERPRVTPRDWGTDGGRETRAPPWPTAYCCLGCAGGPECQAGQDRGAWRGATEGGGGRWRGGERTGRGQRGRGR